MTTVLATVGGPILGVVVDHHLSSNSDSDTAAAKAASEIALAAANVAVEHCTNENAAFLAGLAAWRQLHPTCPGPDL